jgi:predicted transcriptional regulator with HTH domain
MDNLSALKRYDYTTYISLSSSDVRRNALLFLVRNPRNTIYQISRGLKVSYMNTRGAILGHMRGYKELRSLISLGLVLTENDGRITYYSLSAKGCEIAELLEEQG